MECTLESLVSTDLVFRPRSLGGLRIREKCFLGLSALSSTDSTSLLVHSFYRMAARVIAAALIAVAAGQEPLSLDDECTGEEQCALNALQRRGEAVSLEKTAEAAGAPKCAALHHPSNSICRSTVEWAHRGGKYDRHGPQWFADMQSISGVDYHRASLGDWQKLYFCAPPGGKQCGSPPCTCTNPPCDVCFQGKSKAKCSDPDSIACKPPATALDYNGMAWEDMNVSGTGPFHVFAIGSLPAPRFLNPFRSPPKPKLLGIVCMRVNGV